MRIVGVARAAGAGADVDVASLSEDGGSLTVRCGLEDFWEDPEGCLARPAEGVVLSAAAAQMVPPVPPGAQMICIGLNYLRHVAEGSYRGEALPEHPTL